MINKLLERTGFEKSEVNRVGNRTPFKVKERVVGVSFFPF